MKKMLSVLCALLTVAFMGTPLAANQETPQESIPTVAPQKPSLEEIAKRHGIRIFKIPGTDKRLFVHLGQLTSCVNVGWSAALFNHAPKNSPNKLFYTYSVLTALLNYASRGYGSALYVLGASWGPQFLTVSPDDETCKTHLLRGLMTSQFVNGLYEVDKIMSNPLMESDSITKKFGVWVV